MQIAMAVPYAGSPAEAIAVLPDCVHAGVSMVCVPEVYGFDAVSLLGHLTATLPGVALASDILPIYTRTPALLAMTAAGLDALSGGRFTLGLGASGPQVIEGFHGVAYDAPVARTREIIAMCRAVWRRERLEHSSAHYDVPRSRERGGSGLGKPLKLITTPVREQIPVMVAAMGPKNVEMAAELAQEWAPFFFRPEGAEDVWGESLRAGAARRDPSLGPMGIVAPVSVAITDDEQEAEGALDSGRSTLALYVGGMGAKGKNFYYDLAVRYGYGRQAEAIQDHFLAGRHRDAAAAVPRDLLASTSLVGPRSYVAERLDAFAAAGVSTLLITPAGRDHTERLATIEALADLVG